MSRLLPFLALALLLLAAAPTGAQCPGGVCPPGQQFVYDARPYGNGNGHGYGGYQFQPQQFQQFGQPYVEDGRPLFGSVVQFQQPQYFAPPQYQRRPLLQLELRVGGRSFCPCCGRPF